MSNSVTEAMNSLKSLGRIHELCSEAARGTKPAARPRVNSHIHLPPNFSAFTSVEQAVDLAAKQEVGVLGVSNYYDYDVYGDFVALAKKHAIFPLFGLEIIALIDCLVKEGVKINDPGNPGKIYICGKGITRFAPMNAEAQRLIDTIRRNDTDRMRKTVERLAQVFAERGVDTKLDESAVIDMVVQRHNCPRSRVYLQERHACQAFQERFFELVPENQRVEALSKVLGVPAKVGPTDHVTIQNEIRTHLMKAGKVAFVPEQYLSFEEAHKLILELGGIPCYPTLADGTSPVCPYEEPVEKLIQNIRSANVHAAEFIPIRNSPEVLTQYVTVMRKAGLVVTAGTEHNTLDLLPIEPTCLKGAPVPEECKAIFWEGACVVAAHQFITLHGETGFVDAAGKPNQHYANDEERIASFAKLGAAVIEKYYRSCR